MSWFQFFIIFSLVWWLVFFCILPIGIKTAEESGETVVEGQEMGAPVKAGLKRKALYTTAIALALSLLGKWVMDTFEIVL